MDAVVNEKRLKGKWHIGNISEDSEMLVELFLNCFSSENSKKTYANAIRRLREAVDKKDFSKLNYNDFCLCRENFRKTNSDCITSFFQFLYSNDYLADISGFEHCYWDKNKLKIYFSNLKNRSARGKSKFKPSLSLLEIEKLTTFCKNVLDDDITNLRLAFCFHLLYFEDIDASDIRDKLDASDYIDNYVRVGDRKYLVPDKYIALFEYLKDREQSKFSTLNLYITKLGEKVGIAGLKPTDITDSRKNALVMCPECGESFLFFTDNWKSINGKLVCSVCAETILDDENVKKNDNANDLECYEIDIISAADKKTIERAVSSYEILLNRLNSPTDFEELNKYFDEIGKLGEKYVYEKEKERLRALGSSYWELVDETPAYDNKNGYDILSYTTTGEKIYIEVKSTAGDADQPFYISENERCKAKEMWDSGEIYQIHRVFYVTNKDLVSREIYEDESQFDFSEIVYRVTKKNKINIVSM